MSERPSAEELLKAVRAMVVHPPAGASAEEVLAGLRGFLHVAETAPPERVRQFMETRW